MYNITHPHFVARVSEEQELIFFKILKTKKDKSFDCNEYSDLADVKKISFDTEFNRSAAATKLKKLILPEKASSVCESAFRESPITTLVWPSACYEIPVAAFMDSKIEDVLNIGHVTAVGADAFCGSHIKSFSGPNVGKIGTSAFYGCEYLETVAIPPNVSSIPYECFYSCKKLSCVTGLEHVWEIGIRAFSNCFALASIPPLDKIAVIEASAFFKTGLECVDISKSVCESISRWAFANTKLREFKNCYFPCEICDTAFLNTPYEKEAKNEGAQK